MVPVVSALTSIHLVVDAVKEIRMKPAGSVKDSSRLPVVLFGNFPAFNLRKSKVGDRHFERKFGHPNGEAGETLVGSVFDEDAGV